MERQIAAIEQSRLGQVFQFVPTDGQTDGVMNSTTVVQIDPINSTTVQIDGRQYFTSEVVQNVADFTDIKVGNLFVCIALYFERKNVAVNNESFPNFD